MAGQVAAWLCALGVDRAYAMESHHLGPLLPALLEAGICVHVAATETGAGYMADGYARATGRLGVAVTGGGPGLAMMLPALQTAMVEGVPILALVGQSATSRSPKFQETDAGGSRDVQVLRGLLGAVSEVRSADGLHPALESGRAALRSGSPAAVALPVDVQAREGPSPMPLPSAPFSWGSVSGGSGAGDAATRISLADAGGRGRCQVAASAIGGPVRYRDLMAVIARWAASTRPEARIFVDAGQGRHAAHVVLGPLGAPFYDCPRSAPMGWAIAAAVGAALALESAVPVVCITGDGSALMLGNEFATAVRDRASVTFVLCDNGVMGGPHSRHAGTAAVELAQLPRVDWVGWATSMGLPARRAASASEFADALGAWRVAAGPRLIVVPTPPSDDQVRPPYAAQAPTS